MDVKITQKNERPLLSRTDLIGEMHFEATTPSRVELRKRLAEAVKSPEELVVITVIRNAFGCKKASFTAHLYKSKDDLNKNESKVYLNKGIKREKKQKEAKPAAKK